MHKFIPVRVTSKQRTESFLNGEIYMSPLYRFGSWGRRDGASDVQKNFRGDMTEGAVHVFSDPIEGGLNMLSSIPDSIKPLVDKITWVDLGDLQYYKVLCFYSLLYDVSNDWIPTNRMTVPTLSGALPLALPLSMNTDKGHVISHYPDMSLFIPVGLKMVSLYGPKVSLSRIKGTVDAIDWSFYAGIFT